MKNVNKITKELYSGNDFDILEQSGVTIIDRNSVYIEKTVEIMPGSVIYPMVRLSGKTKIGKDCIIYSFTDIEDTTVGDGTDMRSTYAVSAVIGEKATLGPFCCLRKGSVIGDNCRVGDFVEIKNSKLESGVKAAHLAYVGDSYVGENTNVGCGTVFANYDGKVKRSVKVGRNVFIGCNSNLIAPLKIGDNAYIAGGSTVTHDVPDDTLCVARTRQTVKDNWTKPALRS